MTGKRSTSDTIATIWSLQYSIFLHCKITTTSSYIALENSERKVELRIG